MSILIGPDFVPTKHNVELFNSGNVIALVGKELLEILKGAFIRFLIWKYL